MAGRSRTRAAAAPAGAPIPPGQEPTRRTAAAPLELLRDPDGECTLVLKGELDMLCAPDLTEVAAQLRGDGAAALTLDVSRLDFIDSSGLRAILLCRELFSEPGCAFSLTRGSDAVQRVLAIANLADELQDPGDGATALGGW